MKFERKPIAILRKRLDEAPAYIIVVSGPRQIGKSTMVRQALEKRHSMFVATDQPIENTSSAFSEVQSILGSKPTAEWLIRQWTQARAEAKALPENENYILVIDEIQKIPQWSETVKGLWDADRATNLNLHIILLGSSPWLMQKGLTESLAGRFEPIRLTHWAYSEMREAFNFSLEEYIYFGGYPGSTHLIRDEQRWREYVRHALIQPNIEKDILQMTRVDKPALLETMFKLGCNYSGQIISYTKLLGQLQDAGNTVTLAHYLTLLSQAGLLTGITKYAEQPHRQRASSPKLNTLNTALMSSLTGYGFEEARADRSYWGNLVESAVGAHLLNTASDNCRIHYWKDSNHEVDFIVTNGRAHAAIEVKSGANYAASKTRAQALKGLHRFGEEFKTERLLLIGNAGKEDISVADFLSHTADEWLHGVSR